MCDCCGLCIAVAQGLGLWSSPVEGQLPSSLETTPTDVLVAAGEAGGSSTWGRHASKCPQAAALDRDKQRERSSTQEQQQHHRSDAPQPGRVRQPLAVVPSVTPAAQDAPDEDMQPLPTVVLSDVPAVACNGAGRQQGAAAAHGSTSQRATHSSSGNVQQQQQHAPQQHASAREPLRWVPCTHGLRLCTVCRVLFMMHTCTTITGLESVGTAVFTGNNLVCLR
jgi:hypothetical protein